MRIRAAGENPAARVYPFGDGLIESALGREGRAMSSPVSYGRRDMSRHITVTEFVTLDGVMEDPGGAEGASFGGWAFKFDRGDAGNRFKLDERVEADAQLLGRKTYEGFAAAWPDRTDDQDPTVLGAGKTLWSAPTDFE